MLQENLLVTKTGILRKMKTISIVLLSLFLLTCSQSIVENENNDYASIMLKFNKLSMPENIIGLTAYISRAGHDTVTKTLNLLTAASADLYIDKIVSGNWHLKVDAYNDNG